jgi:malonate-semialdehyde dehydrogenase (acetylating)/methylmalonate-semialdehyde dehydrogenase
MTAALAVPALEDDEPKLYDLERSTQRLLTATDDVVKPEPGDDVTSTTESGLDVTTNVRVLENYVGGSWVAPSGGRLLDVLNPATQEPLARVPLSTAADLERAVEAARGAFQSWRSRSPIARSHVLFRLRERLAAEADELARLVTTEMGKTLPDARAEVGRMIEMVEAATAVPTTMQGRILEGVATNVDVETIRQPVGVCAAIVPFNFPAMVPFWFLPFALATGNTFILKPSEQVPLTQNRVFEILDELELPPGVVNLVNGDAEVVRAILDSPGIDAVSFVGSARVARIVYEGAAKAGKRVQALGGAKNHMVVMPDADVPRTVDGLLKSAFGAAGQRCMAGSVVVTVGDAHEALMDPLAEAAKRLRVGNGLDADVAVGPVISCQARERIEGYLDRAVAAGARLVLDGRRSGDGDHAFVGPTIVDGVTPEMEIAQDEVFGPVLAIVHAPTLADAIAIVNRSRYGNGTSIFTESGAAVRRYRHDVEAGMVGVNIGVAAPVAFFPFSGWKDSFFGDIHAHGPDAIDFYTRKKTITSRYFSESSDARLFGEF